jgi:chromosome partitioning protein
MTTAICLLNQKGGVGKTSTCHHLSGAFSKQNRRVLLVDLDFQCNLTQGLFGSEVGTSIPKEASVHALFDDSLRINPQSLIQPTQFENIFVIAGSPAMNDPDFPAPQRAGVKQLVLKKFVTRVGESFEIILFDCRPDIHLPTWNAMVASEFVIIPAQPEVYGVHGLALMKEAVAAVQAGPNPKLKLLGYLITMYDKRLALHLQYEEVLRSAFGEEVLQSTFPLSVKYKEAVNEGKPIAYYKPKSKYAIAIDQLADEVLRRARGVSETGARRVEAAHEGV